MWPSHVLRHPAYRRCLDRTDRGPCLLRVRRAITSAHGHQSRRVGKLSSLRWLWPNLDGGQKDWRTIHARVLTVSLSRAL